MLREGGVELLVELARRVVGDVESATSAACAGVHGDHGERSGGASEERSVQDETPRRCNAGVDRGMVGSARCSTNEPFVACLCSRLL